MSRSIPSISLLNVFATTVSVPPSQGNTGKINAENSSGQNNAAPQSNTLQPKNQKPKIEISDAYLPFNKQEMEELERQQKILHFFSISANFFVEAEKEISDYLKSGENQIGIDNLTEELKAKRLHIRSLMQQVVRIVDVCSGFDKFLQSKVKLKQYL